MNIIDLIERGYFPKELPPPFNTLLLAGSFKNIHSKWDNIYKSSTDYKNTNLGLIQNFHELESNTQFKERKKVLANSFILKYGSSTPIKFSISKGKFSRRYLNIPNPKHFINLAEKISSNWSHFDDIYKQSNFSASYPVIEIDRNKRSIKTFSKDVANFRNRLLITSFNKTIEVRIDISKFYSSIYTHSISWAFLGKEIAKNYYKQKNNINNLITNGDFNALLYDIADDIDNSIRACQEQQSIGIPIGPDTSLIIAELIACRIDTILEKEFSNLNFKACRYFDDYYFYLSTKDQADQILKGLHKILVEFQLEINEGKIQIREFPFSFEDDYSTRIHQFQFKKTNLENSLRHYFSLIWGLVDKNPSKGDTIFKYALKTFEYRTTEISKNNWKIFEALLFKTAIIEPSTLDIVTRILLTYETFLDISSKKHLKELIEIVIQTHSSIKHNFEVAWALWLAKSFNIEISEENTEKVLLMKDPISSLILFDLRHNTNLITGSPNWAIIENEINEDVFFSELWILGYEAIKKGWIYNSNPNLLKENLYFNLLEEENIEFYDGTNQLEIYNKIEKDGDIFETKYILKDKEIVEKDKISNEKIIKSESDNNHSTSFY